MSSLLNGLLSIAALWLAWKLVIFVRPRKDYALRHVVVLVLGDVGRSPRMMYHAQSFAENNFNTRLIGYGGSSPISALERLPKLTIAYLPELPKGLRLLPFILFGPIKVLYQIAALLNELLISTPSAPEFIIVQNPPSIPTLAIVWLVSIMRGSKIIIDWHNLGYSILALKLGNRHPLVTLARWFEAKFGQKAFAHIFVTSALKEFLSKEWNLIGHKTILHDRPPKHFHPSSAQEIHELFIKLEPALSSQTSLKDFLPSYSSPNSTAFTLVTESDFSEADNQVSMSHGSHPIPLKEPTYVELGPPTLRSDRPALLVSSTSWTPDEDFSILLEALQEYEIQTQSQHSLPKVLVIVTGKGPERDFYMEKVLKLTQNWTNVRCISMWLEADDYPILLGAADLGVSLHSSSSKMDLPMKVVDMFGCGLPVCALAFDCLHELVIHDVNGAVFSTSNQLAQQLVTLFARFPEAERLSTLRKSLKSAVQRHSGNRQNNDQGWDWGPWDEQWDRLMKPILLQDARQ